MAQIAAVETDGAVGRGPVQSRAFDVVQKPSDRPVIEDDPGVEFEVPRAMVFAGGDGDARFVQARNEVLGLELGAQNADFEPRSEVWGRNLPSSRDNEAVPWGSGASDHRFHCVYVLLDPAQGHAPIPRVSHCESRGRHYGGESGDAVMLMVSDPLISDDA